MYFRLSSQRFDWTHLCQSHAIDDSYDCRCHVCVLTCTAGRQPQWQDTSYQQIYVCENDCSLIAAVYKDLKTATQYLTIGPDRQQALTLPQTQFLTSVSIS